MGQLLLGELIRAVAAQLREAMADPPDSPVLELRDCEIEVGVTVERQGDAGVNVYAFTLGGHIARSEVSTIRVRFGAVPDVVTGIRPQYLLQYRDPDRLVDVDSSGDPSSD
ncbi:MAG TPA: trypco2 family protein [Mycobacteriales bacterium]|nr:trypco2 family protein [Mycobacteriales bacterium]